MTVEVLSRGVARLDAWRMISEVMRARGVHQGTTGTQRKEEGSSDQDVGKGYYQK